MINVDFTEETDKINAKTEIEDSFNFTGLGLNREFKINWTVKMPYETNLILSNRYGNVDIDELRGLVNIDIRYGDLSAGKLTRGNTKPLNRLAVSYGKAKIDETGWLDVYARYSKPVSINRSQALLLDTRYSTINIGETSSIVSDSKYDNFEIEKINNLIMASAYSQVHADYLAKKLTFEASYTGMNIDKIPDGFESLEVKVRYHNVNLGISENASYNLEGESSYGGIKFDDSNIKVRKRIVENTSSEISGFVGNNESSSSQVKISVAYGTVKL
jgi:hypothetical protein